MTLFILRVRHSRCAAAPYRGTSCSIRYHHPVSEKLRNKLRIWSLTTACTCTRELKERSLILATRNGLLVHRILLRSNLLWIISIIEILLLITMFLIKRFHFECLCWADICTVAAAKAIHRRYGHRKLHALSDL